MKKFLVALGLALCATGLVSEAYAQSGGGALLWQEGTAIPFIHQTTNPIGKTYVDSTYFTRGGAWRVDTTTAVDLTKFSLSNQPSTSTVDSLQYFGIVVQPVKGNPITLAGDSLFVVQQVSMDGANWVTVTQTRTFYASGAQLGLQILKGSASYAFQFIWPMVRSTPNGFQTAFAATAPTALQMFGWHYCRFIMSSTTLAGEFEVFVPHWQLQSRDITGS